MMVRDVVHGIRVAETSNLQIGVRSIFDGQYHTPRKRQSNRELKSYKADPSCRKSRVMNLCEAVNEKQPAQVVGVTTL